MKIISVEKLDEKIAFFYEDEEYYHDCTIDKSNEIEYSFSYPKERYDDYEHFAIIFGKFNPYVFFALNPVEVKKLDYVELLKISHKFPQVKD